MLFHRNNDRFGFSLSAEIPNKTIFPFYIKPNVYFFACLKKLINSHEKMIQSLACTTRGAEKVKFNNSFDTEQVDRLKR